MARRKVDEIFVEITADTTKLDADLDGAVNKVDRAVDRMNNDPRSSPGGRGRTTDALEQFSRAALMFGQAKAAFGVALSAAESISFYSAAFRGDWEAAAKSAETMADTMGRIPGLGIFTDFTQQGVDKLLDAIARAERNETTGDTMLRMFLDSMTFGVIGGGNTGLGQQLEAEETLRGTESKLAQAQLRELLKTLGEDLRTLQFGGPAALREVEARRNIFAQAEKLFQSIAPAEIERTGGFANVSNAIKEAFIELELERLESKSKPPTEEEARLGVTQTVESVLGAFKTGEERQIAKNTQDTADASKKIVRSTERTANATERFAMALT